MPVFRDVSRCQCRRVCGGPFQYCKEDLHTYFISTLRPVHRLRSQSTSAFLKSTGTWATVLQCTQAISFPPLHTGFIPVRASYKVLKLYIFLRPLRDQRFWPSLYLLYWICRSRDEMEIWPFCCSSRPPTAGGNGIRAGKFRRGTKYQCQWSYV